MNKYGYYSTDDNNSANIQSQIAYHKEMEDIANRAGDFTRADHHRKMQEIYKAMKEESRERIDYL